MLWALDATLFLKILDSLGNFMLVILLATFTICCNLFFFSS